jgi:aminocarboxymuconate-semialdehyde decarboxylase
MMNNVGNPFEATVASMAFILTGTLDAFPKLDIYLPHAGGALPWLVWRTDWAMSNNNQFKNLKLPRASDYLRRFHYDLILHSPKLMRTLIEMVGADRVVSGTDYPQGMAVMKPVEYVESIPGITQRERELILCENPARLLKI